MKTLLILFVLAASVLSPAAADAGKHHRRHKTSRPPVITIENRAGAAWTEVIAETVAEFLPYRPIRLTTGSGGCETGTATHIILCEAEMPANVQGYSSPGQIGVIAQAALPRQVRENIVCHEFMHQFTGVADAYDSNPDSCVWGRLPDLGSVDIALLTRHGA